jgi:SAM-dependent methyltransferase
MAAMIRLPGAFVATLAGMQRACDRLARRRRGAAAILLLLRTVDMDVLEINRRAWDLESTRGSQWTRPVGPEVIQAAREGRWEVILTPRLPVPRAWFPDLRGLKVLCLASGGGQQAPVLAAAGASVTLLDNSPVQLGQDRLVAERDGLTMELVEGDMADLSMFEDERFDLIFHPCSNGFVPDVRPVWREAFRVLRRPGSLLAGFCNPFLFLFDEEDEERGILRVRHKLPFSTLESLTEEERKRRLDAGDPLQWSHSLDAQIGGQIEAGFLIAGFYEDDFPGTELAKYAPAIIATRAIKI